MEKSFLDKWSDIIKQTPRIYPMDVRQDLNAELSQARARIAELERENETVMLHGIESMARIAELEKALEPFAKSAAHFTESNGFGSHAFLTAHMTVGDLRRARAALSGDDKEET
jgi:hypothetical protein